MMICVSLVLDGEVLDLRVCLQSADRELNELKKENKEEKKAYESRVMEHMQRVSSPLAVFFLSQTVIYMYMYFVDWRA